MYEIEVAVDGGSSETVEYTSDDANGDCTIVYIETRPGTLYIGSHESAEESIDC
ncbi:hypothetical protein [Haladaptatus sp. NG-SE-30]